MHLQVADGRAELASFVILCDDDSTVLCFSQQELDQQKEILDEAEVTYTVETVTWTDEQRQTVTGKTYATADEARQDLSGTRQPTDNERIITLQAQLTDEKALRGIMQAALDDIILNGGGL